LAGASPAKSGFPCTNRDRARAVLPQINAAMQDERKHQAATYTRWALSRVTDDRPK